jgi:hypothetical protein
MRDGGALAEPKAAVEAPPVTRYRCPADLELLATAGGETLSVGMVDPGTVIVAQKPSAGLVELVQPDWLRLVDGASFWARGPDARTTCPTAGATAHALDGASAAAEANSGLAWGCRNRASLSCPSPVVADVALVAALASFCASSSHECSYYYPAPH